MDTKKAPLLGKMCVAQGRSLLLADESRHGLPDSQLNQIKGVNGNDCVEKE